MKSSSVRQRAGDAQTRSRCCCAPQNAPFLTAQNSFDAPGAASAARPATRAAPNTPETPAPRQPLAAAAPSNFICDKVYGTQDGWVGGHCGFRWVGAAVVLVREARGITTAGITTSVVNPMIPHVPR